MQMHNNNNNNNNSCAVPIYDYIFMLPDESLLELQFSYMVCSKPVGKNEKHI
jgi:hypothetical protein